MDLHESRQGAALLERQTPLTSKCNSKPTVGIGIVAPATVAGFQQGYTYLTCNPTRASPHNPVREKDSAGWDQAVSMKTFTTETLAVPQLGHYLYTSEQCLATLRQLPFMYTGRGVAYSRDDTCATPGPLPLSSRQARLIEPQAQTPESNTIQLPWVTWLSKSAASTTNTALTPSTSSRYKKRVHEHMPQPRRQEGSGTCATRGRLMPRSVDAYPACHTDACWFACSKERGARTEDKRMILRLARALSGTQK